MSINLYDDALVNKIKKWVKDPNMHILKPGESTRLLEMKADEGDDKPIQLPLIEISREKDIKILNTQKQSKTFSGFKFKSNEKVSIPINVIPIELGYQIDIYTRKMEEANEYIRNFVFNFINLPNIKICVPYNDANLTHMSTIWLDDTITDNSDISEHTFPDQFVRFTLKLAIDDAYLFSLPIKQSAQIESLEMQVKDRTTDEIVESSVIIDTK